MARQLARHLRHHLGYREPREGGLGLRFWHCFRLQHPGIQRGMAQIPGSLQPRQETWTKFLSPRLHMIQSQPSWVLGTTLIEVSLFLSGCVHTQTLPDLLLCRYSSTFNDNSFSLGSMRRPWPGFVDGSVCNWNLRRQEVR